jgi:predicted MFS family arabinose efflux permease
VTTRRLRTLVIGPRSTRRLAIAHAIDDLADSMINLSLVGSLFFSVSFDASRQRVLLYLVLTAVPLAVVAPTVGPLLDRLRTGYVSVIVGSQIVRAIAAIALANSLRSAAFYPLVFVVLLCRKAYALAKTAVVAQLAAPDEMVEASGHLARTGTIAGGIGTAIAGIVIAVVGVEWVPVLAACGFAVAAFVSSRLQVTRTGVLVPTLAFRAVMPPAVRSATRAVAAIRFGTGALTYMLALAIKRGGGDELIFAAALLGAGFGVFVGTIISPSLHRRLSAERMVVAALLGPGLVSALGVLTIGSWAIVVIATAIGLGASVSSRAMDAFYGEVPRSIRGRTISRCEFQFQLATLTGAALAVWAAPEPRTGFAVVAVVLMTGGWFFAAGRRLSLRHETARLLLGRSVIAVGDAVPIDLVREAERSRRNGQHRVAIALAESAVRVAAARSSSQPVEVDPTWTEVEARVAAASASRLEPTDALADAVIAAAQVALDRIALS